MKARPTQITTSKLPLPKKEKLAYKERERIFNRSWRTYLHTNVSRMEQTENYTPPKPELLTPRFNPNNSKFKSWRSNNANDQKISNIIYANGCISRWFPVGFDNDDERSKFPDYVTLREVSFDSIKPFAEKPLALIFKEGKESGGLRSPWEYVAENVVKDLLTSFERVRNEMVSNKSEKLTPTLVARFGKIIFWSGSSFDQKSEPEDLACDEETLRGLKMTFNTRVPKSYMEYISKEGVKKIGVEFEEEKDLYHVKLSDSTRPDSTFSCKCRVSKDRKLLLHKTELYQVRYMVTDISCLDKNLDLRLMLTTKRITTSLSDDDRQSIQELIDNAVFDAGVKSGLRWSSEKSSSGRFSVAGAWHTTSNIFVNRSMRLKVRDADRFDARTSLEEASWEIAVKLKRIASELKEQSVDESAVKETLKDDLRLLWDSFFCCESFMK